MNVDPPKDPFERRCCGDCAYLKQFVTIWCTNKEAIKARGTAMPGIWNCPFWLPDFEYIQQQKKRKQAQEIAAIKTEDRAKNLINDTMEMNPIGLIWQLIKRILK